MSSNDRYRPPRETYQPPTLPPKPAVVHLDAKSPARRRDVPPAVPSPPTHTSRTSPPRPHSRRSPPTASPARTASPPRPPPARRSPNQWFFTTDEVASAPGIVDGLSIAEERLRRAKGVNFIVQAGCLLELPQVTLWVAGVFFHRFYMRNSMVEEKGGVHQYNIAATSLFLANKTEENCRKTRDVIIAVARVAQKNPKLIIDEQSKEYWRWRDSILNYEETMLEQLTFDLMVANPFSALYDILGTLNLLHNKRVREAAWAFSNDSSLSILPLLMDARDIAVSATFFAASVTGEQIDDIHGKPWWVRCGASEENVVKAVQILVQFYKDNPLNKRTDQHRGNESPIFNLENTRRRGETSFSQTEGGSSQNGTPAPSDCGTQSPQGTSNGRGGDRDRQNDAPEIKKESGEEASLMSASQVSRGDSDAVLKAAANDLDVHEGKPNGSNVPSPGGKRKEAEPDAGLEGGRESKRARTAEADEGEVGED